MLTSSCRFQQSKARLGAGKGYTKRGTFLFPYAGITQIRLRV